MNTLGYELLDSGDGRKLERFGDVVIARPCAQAIWKPRLSNSEWNSANASFDREDGLNWRIKSQFPQDWVIEECGIKFILSATDFGHLGVFPEQRQQWQWIIKKLRDSEKRRNKPCEVLNLFAYSGGSTLASAYGGAIVCHLDASHGMVQWASENAALNNLSGIRWIVDDAHKFLIRELKRKRKYDAIILDPPTFGRGEKGEMYKIERDLPITLEMCRELLSDDPLFVLLSAHTPGCTPQVLENVITQATGNLDGDIESGEMFLTGGEDVLPLPSGSFAKWSR